MDRVQLRPVMLFLAQLEVSKNQILSTQIGDGHRMKKSPRLKKTVSFNTYHNLEQNLYNYTHTHSLSSFEALANIASIANIASGCHGLPSGFHGDAGAANAVFMRQQASQRPTQKPGCKKIWNQYCLNRSTWLNHLVPFFFPLGS